MNNSTIYIKGDLGFKPAVLTKLGGTWIHGAYDIGEDTVSFSIPENMELNDFKKAIGNSIIAEYNVSFFDELPGDKFVPGRSVKMSIWR
jgi:hypothetical protein